MTNKRTFLKCDICGNIVGLVEDAGVKLMCCGQEMTELKPNTQEAATEKHLPVATLAGDRLTVTVGTVLHPMTEAHHIAWVMIAQGNLTQRIALEKTGAPSATFLVGDGDFVVYAYCNLHGLWAAAFEQTPEDGTICSAEFSEGCK